MTARPCCSRRALHGLGAQIALALETAALTEEVHRRTSEGRLSALVSHSSDLITVLDAHGAVIYQSPSIEHVLGYTPEEMVGTHITRLLPPDEHADIPTVPATLNEVMDSLEADHEFLLEGGVFTPDLIETWLDYKRLNEVDAIRLRPHPHEFALYYDI